MVRNLLVRGMLSGAVAAVPAFVFAYFLGEPAIDAGIAYEERADAAAGQLADPDLVSRGIQSTVGLGAALLFYGIAIGGIAALVHALVQGRFGLRNPRPTALVVAVTGFVVVILVPMLKYPSNPPGSNLGETIGLRTGLYLLMLGLSVAGAVVAVMLSRSLVERFGHWSGGLLSMSAYVVVVALAGIGLPAVAETPGDFPAAVVWDFRVSTLMMHAILWLTLGLVFGALLDVGARSSGRANAASVRL